LQNELDSIPRTELGQLIEQYIDFCEAEENKGHNQKKESTTATSANPRKSPQTTSTSLNNSTNTCFNYADSISEIGSSPTLVHYMGEMTGIMKQYVQNNHQHQHTMILQLASQLSLQSEELKTIKQNQLHLQHDLMEMKTMIKKLCLGLNVSISTDT
jgi:hypothetical protein